MGKVLDGKIMMESIKDSLRVSIRDLKRPPGLAILHAGSDTASEVYIRGKKHDCKDVGFHCEEYFVDSEIEAIYVISTLNERSDIDGIILQLPVPEDFNSFKIIGSISPTKDVDGLHFTNIGLHWYNERGTIPCTPMGIIATLEAYEIPLEGKHCVIAGRSNLVGKPLAEMMLKRNATVTLCHSKTPFYLLYKMISNADVFVSAVGNKDYLKGIQIPHIPVLIDVGINRDEEGKLCGDIPHDWYEHCQYYTPVPGGVGLMTRAALLMNTYESARMRQGV